MDILREAGFPVWAVLALGAWSLLRAWRYRAGHIEAGELNWADRRDALVGALATAWGVQLSFAALRDVPEPTTTALLGVREALYNLDFALGLAAAATLVATSGRRHGGVASAG
jgi:hypothetical protein